MGNLIKRNTVGALANLDQSIDQHIGQTIGTVDYVKTATRKRLDRSLQSRFGSRSIKQLGKEINPEHDYRIYTNSMNPGIQARKGCINITPRVLEYQINKGYTDPEDRIGIELGGDGLVRYKIQTTQGEKLVTLKQMNTETRERVGQRVSDAIDNSAKRYAGKARLAKIMGKHKLSFGYETVSGLKSSRDFSISFLYDFMVGAYNEEWHPYYRQRAVINAISDKIQAGILGSLKKQKKIDSELSWEELVGLINGVDINLLDRSDINAYDGLFKHDYGVQRKHASLEGNGNFDDIARAAGFDPEALKKSQEENQIDKEGESSDAVKSEEEATTTVEGDEVPEDSQKSDDYKKLLRSFMKEPEKYTYDEVMTELLLWHSVDGTLTDTAYTNVVKIAEGYKESGRFARVSQGNIKKDSPVKSPNTSATETKNTTNKSSKTVGLVGFQKMKSYLADPSQYTRDEAENYLAQLGATDQITESMYDNFLQKMDRVVFKNENIKAKAVV